MSDTPLHEISAAIGRLQGLQEAAERRYGADHQETTDHREEMRDGLAEIRNSLKPLLALKERVDRMEPAVDDWRATKQRGIGLIAAAGLGGGGIAAAIPALLKKIGWSG